MTSRTAYFLKLRQEREERLKEKHQSEVALYLQHVEDPESVAGKTVRIYPDHPSGLATGESRGRDLFIPDHWWDYLPEGHPALVRAGWAGDEMTASFPDSTLSDKEERERRWNLVEKAEEEEHQKKLAAFLLYVTNPNLVRGTTVEIYPGHPSGLGGTSLYIPKCWWEHLPDKHPAMSQFNPPASSSEQALCAGDQ